MTSSIAEEQAEEAESAENGGIAQHDDYPHLMAGPHRRRVTPVGAPALTRHLVFWKPLDWKTYDPTTVPTPSRARSQKIDEFVAAVYSNLLALESRGRLTGVTTNGIIEVDGNETTVLFDSFIGTRTGRTAPKPDNTGADAHRTIKLMFDWYGIPGTMAFENHTEFVTVTTILDLSRLKSAAEISRFKRKHDPIFGRLCKELGAIAKEEVRKPDRCAIAHRYLYDEVWSVFELEMLLSLPDHQADLGRLVADFRGLIIGVNYKVREKGVVPEEGTQGIAMPFSRPGKESNLDLNPRRLARWRQKEFEAIWTLLNCGIDGDTEITASQFLDGRVFYATALGEQSGLEHKASANPLYYLIYEDTANRWQLGRLVYRINFAGTFRVVATMHFEKLREVGGALLRAGTALERALGRSLTHDEGDEESIKALRQVVRRDYEDVEAPLSELSEKDVDGPIYARIERSRYYVSQFRQIARSLRIYRVEGYQRYDEFVLQKIGPVYEYIDRLGRRYTQVQKDRSLLLRRLQALDALYEERVISKAQNVADIALLCVLGPYYMASMVTHVVLDPAWQQAFWLMAGAFGVAMYLLIQLSRKKPEVGLWGNRRMRLVVAGIFGLLIMAGLAAYGWYEKREPAPQPHQETPAPKPKPAGQSKPQQKMPR